MKDRRALALILVAPLVVMALVGFSLYDQRPVLDRVAPSLLAVFVFFFTFVLTGVSFLRERAQGTLERLLTTPVRRADLQVGYVLGFLLFAVVQTAIITKFTLLALNVTRQGALWEIAAPLLLLTIVSVALGVFVSTFARNEFQVVQFIPLVFAPQLFLAGIIIPVEQMPRPLELASNVFPLTYAVSAARGVMLEGAGLAGVWPELAVLAGVGAVLLAAAAATVRRV
jgi:ABC-2 type transport system permease protein